MCVGGGGGGEDSSNGENQLKYIHVQYDKSFSQKNVKFGGKMSHCM